jgi:two-component system chemotaxis sensor kinase CheA
MNKIDDEFLKRIQMTFRVEADEHIRNFCSGISALEKNPAAEQASQIIESMFREIHSLKGAARSIGNKETESLCQPLESVFSGLKRKELFINDSFYNIFYKSAEWLKRLISIENKDFNESDRKELRQTIQQLKDLSGSRQSEESIPETKTIKQVYTEPAKPVSHDPDPKQVNSSLAYETVRIRLDRIDPLFRQAEELIQTKIALQQRIEELTDIAFEIDGWKQTFNKKKTNRSNTDQAGWHEWIEEIDTRLYRMETLLESSMNHSKRDHHNLSRMVDDHLESMKQILMMPVSTLVEIFPAMVKEIARNQEKDINMFISGADLEIDKRILEELKDPLVHLIRNSIDHGIARKKERLNQNKPEKGIIKLEFATKDNSRIEISLSDDGDGINTEKLLKAAIKSGIISKENATLLDYQETINLIFQSGLSTSSLITDISGHGLGMSIVKEKVSRLNGTISVETIAGKGTTFRILLPMSLATFRGILVNVDDSQFIIPTLNVDKGLKVRKDQIKTVENQDTILIGDAIVSVVDLKTVIGLTDSNIKAGKETDLSDDSIDYEHIIVLNSSGNSIGFRVDSIENEQQVLVKGLGKLLRRVRNISGATILGNGKVVPVINTYDLLQSAIKFKTRTERQQVEEIRPSKTGKILVVEDSITSRTMLKNVLETAGYKVITAFDGIDGFTKARTGEFDLIMSDVDMPRMNGFELTARIRSDKNLSQVPVILVTSLETREDQEHGIDAGANAYIVKSSFDQGNLLEAIKKLI